MPLFRLLAQTTPRFILLTGLGLVVLNFLINFLPVNETFITNFNAAFGVLISITVLIFVFSFYHVSKQEKGPFTRTLLLFLITMFAWFIGDLVWFWLTYSGKETFASIADLFYIVAYLMLLFAVFSIPGTQHRQARRKMIFIEMTILILSAIVISIILLMAPGTPDMSFDLITYFVVFVYPVLDIIMIWVIMILFFTYIEKVTRNIMALLLAGSLAILMSDMFYLITSLYSPVVSDFLVDIGYYLYYMFLLLAAMHGYRKSYQLSDPEYNKPKMFTYRNWIIILPGVFLMIVIGLLMVFILNQSVEKLQSVIAIIALIIVLFVVHQYLVIADNYKLTREMRSVNGRLEEKVKLRTSELSQANNELLEQIMERRKAEEYLAVSNQELALLNQDKDKLFTILAHDLRSPMGSVMNLAGLLNDSYSELETKEVSEIIKAMYKSTSQTYQLLNDLLSWSAVQMGRGMRSKEQFSIAFVVNEVIAAMETDAGLKEISIISEVSPNVVVFADRYAILTVIRNLLSNAVKFTPSGGSVSINAIHDNNETLISIADTGIGFSADEAEDVFRIGKGSTPGTSGEKGTGFGLILCKDLVERNNGTIKLTSKLGKGSRFDIRLPMEDTLVLQSVNEADANTPGRIEISWDHYKKLGFSVIEGNFAAAEFREALEKLWRNVDFYPEYGMLADVRRTMFRFENNSASELMNMFANMPGQNISRRFAILTSTPQQVAYATMFSMQIRKKYPFVVEVFSTHEAAILWLSGS